MTESVNPYRAPSEDVQQAAKPSPGALIDRRLEFSGLLSRQDHLDSIRKARIRQEYQGSLWLVLSLAAIICSLILVVVLVGGNGSTELIRVSASAMLIGCGVFAIFLRNWWVMGWLLPSNQLMTGNIQGYIDDTRLRIDGERISTISELSQLTSTATSKRVWVLNFSPELLLWHTIPFDAFDDRMAAETTAQNLKLHYPPTYPMFDDARKTPPDMPFAFDAMPDAVSFDGKLKLAELKGSRFHRASKRLSRDTVLVLGLALGAVILGLLLLIGFQFRFVVLILSLFLLTIGGLVAFYVWRSGRGKSKEDKDTIWYSRGWFDDVCYCSMTVTGQSRMTWDFFDHMEITDQLISLFPHVGDTCCCLIGRTQFASDEDWNRATELVRGKFERRVS